MVEGGSTDGGTIHFLVGNSVPLLVEDGSTTGGGWFHYLAGYSHYLGWFLSKSGLDKLSLNSGRFQVQIWEFLSFLIGNLRFKSGVFDYFLSNHPFFFEQLPITF